MAELERSDILKFLCIGADYVGIGRPAMYGLILKGHNGVKEIFDILNNDKTLCKMGI